MKTVKHGYEDNPWYSDNKHRRYTFYALALVIDDDGLYDLDENIIFGDEVIVQNLNAFTTNEYLFKLYTSFYDNVLSYNIVVAFIIEDSTYDEFIEISKSEYGISFDYCNWIQLDTIGLTGNYIVYNENIYSDVESAIYNTYYPQNEEFYYPIVCCYGICLIYNEYFTSDFNLVNELLTRAFETYLYMVNLTSRPNIMEKLRESLTIDQIRQLSDRLGLSDNITNYEYCNFVCTRYLILKFLKENTSVFGKEP